MFYLVPIAIVILGFAADLIVEVSAEVSSDIMLESDAGVAPQGARLIGGNVVDMRPEASLSGAIAGSSGFTAP